MLGTSIGFDSPRIFLKTLFDFKKSVVLNRATGLSLHVKKLRAWTAPSRSKSLRQCKMEGKCDKESAKVGNDG